MNGSFTGLFSQLTICRCQHLHKEPRSLIMKPTPMLLKAVSHISRKEAMHAVTMSYQFVCRVVRWRELAQEIDPKQANSAAIRQALAAEDQQTNSCLYLLLRAVDRFHALHSRFPGCYDRCACTCCMCHTEALSLQLTDDIGALCMTA